MVLSSCFLRMDLSLVKVNLTTEKNQANGNTFLIMDSCSQSATTRTGRSLENGNGFLRVANLEQKVASMIKKISTVNGRGITRMVNFGTKGASNMVRRKAYGGSTMRPANF